MSIRRAKRRGRAEGGAALVEFALIVPVLFTILLGTLTGGLTLSRQNSVENAVREATRYGAVYPNADIDAYLNAVLAQAEAGATGDLADGVPGKRICVAYIDGTGATRIEKVGASTGSSESGTCFSDGRSENRVQVRAERTSDIKAVLFNQTVTLSSKSVTRYER